MNNDIIKRFIELLAAAQPSLSEEIAVGIERQLRIEYAGERVYVPKRDEAIRIKIAARHNGQNIDKLARDMRVSRRTVYYAIKAKRKSK